MTQTTHQTVEYTISDGVAHVEIDRADKLNSLTRDVFEDLLEAGLAIKGSTEVRAVVLSGRGRAFSAGLDFTELARIAKAGVGTRTAREEEGDGDAQSGDSSDGPIVFGERLGAARALGQQIVHIWSLIEVPVIAAVRGVALGGGFQVALGADMRVASPDAKFSPMEVKWGIIPDMCGTQILPRLVGPAQAKKLIVTAEAVGAEEALRIGLIEEIAEDPVARALEMAGQIAGHSRSALAWAKKLVDMSYESDLATGLDAEQEALAALLGTEEQQQVVAERLAKMKERAKG
jgi:enoyl-CoA hydratase/carnithine racemase